MELSVSYSDILEAFDDMHVLRKHKVYHRRVLFRDDKEFVVLCSNRDYLHALSFKDKFMAFYKLNYYKIDESRVNDTPFPKKMKEELGLYYLLKLDRLPL